MTAHEMYVNQAATAWDRGDYNSLFNLIELMEVYAINQMEKEGQK